MWPYLHPVHVDTCLLLHTDSFCCPGHTVMCYGVALQPPLHDYLPPATSSTFSFQDSSARLHGYTASYCFLVRRGTTDITLLGGVYNFIGRGTYTLLCFTRCFTLSALCRNPSCMMARTCLYYVCLLFASTQKPTNEKPHTHMSLPATWWLSFTLLCCQDPAAREL
jgi:hypothetical protein